ncbi:MAG: hypothetical protein KBD12_01020 [Candidatus Pacebacteria bacterium]|nr:hypothetical protein [Candidatus Paceibacterota bacterium]
MKASYLSDDFYICFSNIDLDLLKKEKQITSFIIFNTLTWTFLIKLLKNKDKEKVSSILFSEKFKKFKLILSKEDSNDLFQKGKIFNRIGKENIYFYTEKYNFEEFNEKSLLINNLSTKVCKSK